MSTEENFEGMESEFKKVQVTSSPNIAVIKYWGKRDVPLNLPTNSSFSLQLDYLKTITTIERCEDEDALILNGKEDSIPAKMKRLIDFFRRTAKVFVRISSENTFPTAAGFASSASGYSALVYALATFFNHPHKDDLSKLSVQARLGSGSATRSLHGGWVKWDAGKAADGSDSIAIPYFPHTHWSDLCVVVFQVCGEKKTVSSTKGMQRTVKTSDLFNRRLSQVDRRIEIMVDTVRNRNFKAFAELTMKDSNQFHATCLDSYPPIHYLNGTSFEIIDFVHEFNGHEVRAGYTFDAGANAFVFIQEKDLHEFLFMAGEKFCPSGKRFEDWCDDPFGLAKNIKLDAQSNGDVEKLFVLRGGPGVMSTSTEI